VPYFEISAFVRALREYRRSQSVAAYALELLILTGVRTNDVLGARWPEIDLANGAARKAVLAHVVGGVEGRAAGLTLWKSGDPCSPRGRTTSMAARQPRTSCR
jgi:hypothetical protein